MQMKKLSARRLMSRKVLVFALILGIVIGSAAWLFTHQKSEYSVYFWEGVYGTLAFTLLSVVAAWARVSLIDRESTSLSSPTTSWRSNLNYSIITGVMFGLGFGLLIGGIVWVITVYNNITGGFASGIVAGFIWGLAFTLTTAQAWSASVAAAQLAMRWRTPVRLMRFLDDARKRNILRTVGPVYQFRHARLQDRLALASNGSGNDRDASSRLFPS